MIRHVFKELIKILIMSYKNNSCNNHLCYWMHNAYNLLRLSYTLYQWPVGHIFIIPLQSILNVQIKTQLIKYFAKKYSLWPIIWTKLITFKFVNVKFKKQYQW